MGVALLYTQAGNVYNYYGNEIGMRNGLRRDPREDYVDQTYRLAMNWGDRSEITHENGFAYQAYGMDTLFGAYDDYLGGVAEQTDDQNSLYNFYRRIMLLRRQNPEIARGSFRIRSVRRYRRRACDTFVQRHKHSACVQS